MDKNSEVTSECKSPSGCYLREVRFASGGSCVQHSPLQSKGRKKKINSLGLANATVLTCHLNLTYAGRSWGERAGTELGEKGGSWKLRSVWSWKRGMLTHVRHRRCHTLCTHASRSSVRCRCSYLFFYMFHKHNPHLGSKDKRRASKTQLLDKDKPRVYKRLPVPPNLFKAGKQLNGFFRTLHLKENSPQGWQALKKKNSVRWVIFF